MGRAADRIDGKPSMTIAEYIEKDVKAKVMAGEDLPFRLTLTAISEFYDVSPMPVRIAVGELVNQGVLIKLQNGRLAVQVDPEAIQSVAGDPQDLPKAPEDHEQELADLAISLSLKGEQQYLREEDTASRLGVGRSVVRRIFSRLSGAGILEHVPRCGWLVQPYREEDMLAYIEVREVLEQKAMDLARDRLDPDDLLDMLRANMPGPDGEPRIDNRLHHYWIDRSGNRYIQDFFRLHGPYYEAMFDYATIAESAVATMAEQHREILQSLLDRKWARARKHLQAHVRGQQPKVLKLITSYRNDLPSTDG